MNASAGGAPWPAVRSALVDFVRECELPMSRERVQRARHLLIIGTCLGVPYGELLGPPSTARETAMVVSEHCEGLAAASDRVPRFAGSVEKNQLPDGWADVVVGHCVLDEFETPLTAFVELARTAAQDASLCGSGPVSGGSASLSLQGAARSQTTFWPVQRLINDLAQSGFKGVKIRDLTSDLLVRLRQAGVASWWPSEARWIVLEARRRGSVS